MTSAAESEGVAHPIVYDGRLVALAGPRRCHVLVADLDEDELRLVMAMCLCSREVRLGRLPGPYTAELAEQWARILLAGSANSRR
ncbi:MAG: hypothetical protein ACRDPC_01350 [Solirubrobacteraceae bacterium]